MKPLVAMAGTAVATAIAFGSGWAILATSATPSEVATHGWIAIDRQHERAHRSDAGFDQGRVIAGDPDPSSFGTLQEDGTYCGAFLVVDCELVTCFENH